MTERALISALLVDPSNWLEVRAIVTTDDFADPKCKRAFEGIEEMDGKVDLVLITNWLRTHSPELVDYGNEIYSEGMPSLCVEYARAVKNESKNRELQRMSGEIAQNVGKQSANKLIGELEGKLISLYDTERVGFRDAPTMATALVDHISDIMSKKIELGGLSTPWKPLDTITNGLQQSDLIIIGARTSQGKTAMMLQMADHAACALKKRVAFFSLEMSENSLMTRLVSQKAGISFQLIRNGKLDECLLAYVADTAGLIAESQLHIMDVSMIDMVGIRAQLKRLCNAGNKPDVVFVDYLTKIQTDDSRDNMVKKIGRISSGLKACAKELNIPFVVASQLSRGDDDGKPTLKSLRDSGEIEQDADIVILLHREEFYKKDKCNPDLKGRISVDVAKNRNGPTSELTMTWNGEYTRISE